jgi:hypothetical protein
MQQHGTMKNLARHFLLFVFLTFTALPGHARELTQRDWMVALVDATGWSYGLPDEPQDPDYINILMGNREFRFEAEEVFAEGEDNVSVMSFQNFGAFSGQGWLHGTREPTEVHLKFTLPISGTYEIKAHLRQKGHLFKVTGEQKTADAENAFTLVNIGTFDLQNGAQEIIVTLPPNGSIDYISLTAPNLAAITPDGGWQPEEPLDWQVLQTTLIQFWQLAELFPAEETPLVIEAEDLKQSEVKIVTIPHLGQPSGGKWLRAGPLPAEVRFPLTLKKSGFYDLSLRAMGKPIHISVGDHQKLRLDAKPYLEDIVFKSIFLFAGESNITLMLPPGGGVDTLSLTGRQIDATRSNTLLDFKQKAHPEARDLDSISTLLAAFGVER